MSTFGIQLTDNSGNPFLTQTNPGSVQAADGAIASIGTKSDSAVTNPTLNASQIALLKGLLAQLQGSGTGSLPAQLTGNLAPLSGPEPTLIDTIPYSTFTANSTIYRMYNGVFTRNTRMKQILVIGNLNQAFSANPTFAPRDSTIPLSNASWGNGAFLTGGNGVTFTWVTNNAGYQSCIYYTTSIFQVDSLTIQFQIGATAPTSGNVYVYVQEVH